MRAVDDVDGVAMWHSITKVATRVFVYRRLIVGRSTGLACTRASCLAILELLARLHASRGSATSCFIGFESGV